MKPSRRTLATSAAVAAFVVLSMFVASGYTAASSPTSSGLAPFSTGSSALSTGLARNFGLSGPTTVHPTFPASGVAVSSSALVSSSRNTFSAFPERTTRSAAAAGAAANDPPIPTVSCMPASAACDTIGAAPSTVTTNPDAMNAMLNDKLYPTIGDVEPPDQMMCAGAGYVFEGINIGEVQVFNAHTLTAVSGPITLDNLMGLTARGWSSGGDPMCTFDATNGGHWFVTEFVSKSSEKIGGTFAGCFAAKYDACLEGIAVSATSNPMGAYHVYFLDPNKVDRDPGVGFLLNDYAKTATTRDAFLLFYDEFNLNGSRIPACPAFGCGGFNGAQELAFAKAPLEMGASVSSSSVTVAHENLGLVPTPDGRCGLVASNPYTCWYQVIPAGSPGPKQFDNSHGGSGFMVGSLDFFGVGDNRIAVFDWTDLSALNSAGCTKCSGIGFGVTLFTGLETYLDEGGGCPASEAGTYSFCGLASQKTGPVPLGTDCVAFGLVPVTSGITKCPENGLASNGDGATQATFADRQIWFAVSTIVAQSFGTQKEYHVGAAFWSIGTRSFDSGGMLSVRSQGYVTAAHEDILFPSIGASDSGPALMSFTLTGSGYFPSTAYAMLAVGSSGAMDGSVLLTAQGQGAQDGFTEYLGLGTTSFRPRWGDYGVATYVPGLGFVFAGEMIQHPNCSPSAFMKDPTCGGTRDPYANFGTALSLVPA
jgi:hypothetical protein